jgi:hypothetical protein
MGDMGTMTEDDGKTPTEPAIRRNSSGAQRLGEVPCPKCGGALVPCSLCEGRRTVGLSIAVAWNVEHGE